MAVVADSVVMDKAADNVVGFGVTVLLENVLENVKLLSKGNERFEGLRILLARLQRPTAYLESRKERAGETLVQEWLANLRKHLDDAKSLTEEWQGIKRWRLDRQLEALKRLISIIESLELLECSVVHLATNLHIFDTLNGRVDRLDEGVDRLGGEVTGFGEGVDRLGRTVHMHSDEVSRMGEGMGRVEEEVGRLGEGMGRVEEEVGRLGEGMGRVEQEVGRQGEEVNTQSKEVSRLGEELVRVKICLELLVKELRSLNEERRDLAQATITALNKDRHLTLPEAIDDIRRKARRTSVSGAILGSEVGLSSAEAVTSFKAPGLFPDEIVGGNDLLDKVIAEISGGENQKCIGLWSMGGAGKTFTAGRVYHDPRIRSYFDGRRHRIWVTVSKRDTYTVMKEIFTKLGGHEDDFPEADDIYSVRNVFKGQLNLDKLLLVIDDVWEAAQLDFIDLILEPEDCKRRVILVTTRNKRILEGKHATKIEVSLLNEEDSWNLFSRNAFGRTHFPTELEFVSRSVAAECKGLPLALKVIGSTLAGESNLRVWDNSLKKLRHASVLSKDHEEQVFGRLQLSVDNLCDRDDGDSRLQHCFYYFAAYPEDNAVDAQELVSLWTAEGIVGKDPDSPICAEDEAYECLGTLIALSMIEVQDEQSVIETWTSCQIHDVMRDLARYNLENKFGREISTTEKIPAYQRPCLYRSGLQLTMFPEDWTAPRVGDASASTGLLVQRLSFMDNELQQLPGQFDAPHLRVLLLQANMPLRSLPEKFFQSFKALRVLDLEQTGIDKIPEAVCNLISLVLINLSYCTSLRHIPASIERLQNLQQLRICECCQLISVPRSFRNLTSLRVLDMSGTNVWDGQNFSSEDCATLSDVTHLKSLQTLSLSNDSISQVSELAKLTGLQSMLLVKTSLEGLPGSFTQLISLKRLRLTCPMLTWLPALDELQLLQELYVQSEVLESFPDSFFRSGAFPSLQLFHADCEQLKDLVLQQGAMPQVKSFIISSWVLTSLPASLQVLGSLISLNVSFCESLGTLLAFSEPNSFPCLKEINLSSSFRLRNLPARILESAPNLRRIHLKNTKVSRSSLPEEMVKKEKLKQLEILFE